MKRTGIITCILSSAMAFVPFVSSNAQSTDEQPLVLEVADSVAVVADTTVADAPILLVEPSVIEHENATVIVYQSALVEKSMRSHIYENAGRKIKGYRVRIYYDNGQNARNESGGMLGRFKALFPGVPAYMSYSNPYFKVTVGDFRTKSEAMELLDRAKTIFPDAFIVEEVIKTPVMKNNKKVIFRDRTMWSAKRDVVLKDEMSHVVEEEMSARQESLMLPSVESIAPRNLE